ncbi:MAG: hypothetical protein GY934_04830 [Gammaproteobacteria bacterium]|nr:hypothetical protein [Gammaproteobacteria bacterium]
MALGITAVYKSWPHLNPELIASTPLDSECDLRAGPCTGTLSDGRSITLEIEPKSIPVMKPLQFTVRLQGLAAKGIEIDFQGVDMNMGYNRPKLTAMHHRLFKGEGVLPICTRTAMEWEARVLVQTGRGLVAVPFRFVSIK